MTNKGVIYQGGHDPTLGRPAGLSDVAQVSEAELNRLEQGSGAGVGEHPDLFPEVVEVLGPGRRGYRLGVIANLRNSPACLPSASCCLSWISMRSGFGRDRPKPHPQFYRWAAMDWRRPVAATLMVGDTRVPDFSRRTGLWFAGPLATSSGVLPSSESQTLHDLTSLLDQVPLALSLLGHDLTLFAVAERGGWHDAVSGLHDGSVTRWATSWCNSGLHTTVAHQFDRRDGQWRLHQLCLLPLECQRCSSSRGWWRSNHFPALRSMAHDSSGEPRYVGSALGLPVPDRPSRVL